MINPHAPVAQKSADEVKGTDPPQIFDEHLLKNTNLTRRLSGFEILNNATFIFQQPLYFVVTIFVKIMI